MLLLVRLGSPLDEAVGKKEIALSFSAKEVNLQDLLDVLKRAYPKLSKYFPSTSAESVFDFIMPIVNERTVDVDYLLREGDVVTLHLPFCGG